MPVELGYLKVTENECTVRIKEKIEKESQQRVNHETGRIDIGWKGWLFRALVFVSFIALSYVIITRAFSLLDWWTVLAIVMPFHTILILCAGWIRYRNPPSLMIHKPERKTTGTPRVSVLLPIYNQEAVIEQVINQILCSDVEDLEVIAVNDGSTDNSGKILEDIKNRYGDDRLKVIQKKNEGKRKAIGTAFPIARGKYIVVMDSDSIVHEKAIERLVTTLENHDDVGACVSHVKVWNADKSFITRCQSCWYDFAFNLFKACESSFGCVTCCSGCLSAYKRQAIEPFIPYWSNAPRTFSDDRELTSFTVAPKHGKEKLMKWDMPKEQSLSQRIMNHAAQYDDAEDRVLTATAMQGWKSVYVADAFAYTEVPATFRQFYKQQLRWRKGFIRVNAYISTFMWKRNPFMAFIYYYQVLSVFFHPVLSTFVLVYEPFVLKDYWFPLFFLGILFWRGLVFGADYKIRDRSAKEWMYQIPMTIFEDLVMCWVIIPAMIKLRQNNWGTR